MRIYTLCKLSYKTGYEQANNDEIDRDVGVGVVKNETERVRVKERKNIWIGIDV